MEDEATIRKRFERASNEALIEAIESGDYTALAEKVAQEELDWREFSDDELLVMVKAYWIKKITPQFKALVLSKSIPKSKLIDENAMKAVIRKVYDNWKEQQDLFSIDVEKYWPAGLG